MHPFEADRLRASDAPRRAHAARLAQAFDLYLRGASPSLANALADDPSIAALGPIVIITAAIIAVADGKVRGSAVALFDTLRQSSRATPRHDAVLGHAFLAALNEVLGSAFDEPTREAWTDGYVRAVETVMAARRNRMDFVA